MIDWENLQTGLLALVEALAEVPAQMQNEPRDFVDPSTRAVVLLSFFNTATLNSTPDRVYEFGEPLGYAEAPYGDLWGDSSPEVIETVSEVEELVLRVLVESYSQHPADFAPQIAKRIAARLSWTSSGSSLEALDAALLLVEPFTEVSTTYDDRVISAGSFDVRLTVRNTESDTENPLGRIEHTESKYAAGP